MSRIVKDVGLLTSDNVADVLKFLEILVSLLDQARVLGVSEQDVLRLLLSVTTRHLYNAVLKAIQNNNSVSQLHDAVLHQFVTIRLRSEWMMTYYNRTQAPNESMADFISSIEFYAKVLKVPHSEAEIVALIVSGLNAQTRSRLLFANQPHTFSDLHQLAVQATSFTAVDAIQAVPVAQPEVASPNVRPSAGNMRSNGVRPPIQCHYCGKMGHIQRYCYRKTREQRVMSNSASPQQSNHGTRAFVRNSNHNNDNDNHNGLNQNINHRRDGPL